MRPRVYSCERTRAGVSAVKYPARKPPYPARCRAARAAAAAAGTAPNAAARTSAAPHYRGARAPAAAAPHYRGAGAPAATARDPRATAAAAAAAVPSAPLGDLRAERGRDRAFPVEHIERRQADVGDLFFSERELRRSGSPRRRARGRRGCCRCAARQRQRYADDSYHRYDFFRMFSLRTALRVRHSRVLPRLLVANVPKSGTAFVRLAFARGKDDYAR
jgi:hypothetical protein